MEGANLSKLGYTDSGPSPYDQDPPPVYQGYDYDDPDPKQRVKQEEDDDPWAVVELTQKGKSWKEQNNRERCISLSIGTAKIILLLGLLYLFICSLGFLSDAFKLVGGKAAGEAFSQSQILNNPVTCLMIGVLATVLLQSSSTTTSIVVAMVAERIIFTQPAVYIVMGANIGTTVTNTIVSLGQAVDKNEFRRAFGGATVHDMFNWLAVAIILPIEAIVASIPGTEVLRDELLPPLPSDSNMTADNRTMECGMLCHLTRLMVKPMVGTAESGENQDLLKVITNPFTKLVVQTDSKAIQNYAKGVAGDTILKMNCKDVNGTKVLCPAGEEGTYLFSIIKLNTGWSDIILGIILLLIALVMLCIGLVCIVKLLHSMLRGHIANLLKKFVNSDLPGCARHFTGYLAILLGAALTMLVQSSSIFTSAITPLVGIGVLHLERMYPLTLGSNIGTTLTSILASLAQDRDNIPLSLQVAFCHLFFNIIGICIWFPVPVMRKVPVSLAKMMGNTTAEHRWFAIFYLFLLFFIIPAAVFGLSIAGWPYLAGIGGFFLLLFIVIVVINVLQRKKPSAICCEKLRSWDWLPRPLHDLSFYDQICQCCVRRKKGQEGSHQMVDVNGKDNLAFDKMEDGKLYNQENSRNAHSQDNSQNAQNGHINVAYVPEQSNDTTQFYDIGKMNGNVKSGGSYKRYDFNEMPL